VKYKPYFCKVNFLKKLQDRWKVESTFQVVLILTVFALTGTTIVYLKGWLKPYIGDEWWMDIVYYVAILPVYNLVLLIYGFLLGQGKYFWEFEKRFIGRILGKKNQTK
jgi:hypothetical protein